MLKKQSLKNKEAIEKAAEMFAKLLVAQVDEKYMRNRSKKYDGHKIKQNGKNNI